VNLRLSGAPSVTGLDDALARSSRLLVAPSVAYVEAAFNPSKYREMSSAPVIEAVPMQCGSDWWLSCIVQYAPCDLAGGWTVAARERLASVTRDALAASMPDLSARIVDTQVTTPEEIASCSGSPGGHWHHVEMALDQLLTLRPGNGLGRYAAGPKGFFLCGAGTHPGGDVMGLAGRNAARTVLEAKA
jgi:phytoene dehydrogenase-like protein